MKKRKTIWVLMLLVGFTLPTVFQSFHVIEHHTQKTHHHCDHQHSKELPLNADSQISVDEFEGNCAICDFELTDLKVNSVNHYFYSVQHTFICQAGQNESAETGFCGTHKRLRAPPVA